MFPDEVRNGKDILTSEVSVPEDLKPPIKNNCTIKFSEVVAAFWQDHNLLKINLYEYQLLTKCCEDGEYTKFKHQPAAFCYGRMGGKLFKEKL